MNDEHDKQRSRQAQSQQGESQQHALALRCLTELAREELPPAETQGSVPAAFSRFRQAHLDGRDRHRHSGTRRWGTVPVLAVVGLTFLVVGAATWRLANTRPLLVVVTSGGTLDEGGFVRPAGAAATPRLHFSDGTEVDLESTARARVAGTTATGARLMLEDGRARARVVPRKSSQWFFDAGPCRVEVTGTQFDLHWSAAGQILEVMLYSGSVTVKGPPATAGVPMRAGQRLVMNVRQGTVRLGELEAAPGTGAAASPREAAPPVDEKVTTTERRAETEAKSGEPHHRETWAARVASGDFRGVVAQAKRRGIDRVLREDSAENIMALADAARFANSLSLAQRALLSVRARFPQTAPAHRAAFLLGRVAEDQHGNLSGALQWYDTYLSDAPDDSFRAEAMGRKMAATLQVSGPDRARPLATQYLKRYPQGAYAHAARAILAQ